MRLNEFHSLFRLVHQVYAESRYQFHLNVRRNMADVPHSVFDAALADVRVISDGFRIFEVSFGIALGADKDFPVDVLVIPA